MSALIVVEGNGAIEVYAVDASSSALADYPSGSNLYFTALLYEGSLATLELAPGKVKLAGPNDRGRALPAAKKTLQRSVMNDEATAWEEVGVLRPAIEDLKLELGPACGTLEDLWRASLPRAVAPSLIAATGTSAWIIAADAAGESLVWEVDAGGSRSVSSSLPAMQEFSAVRGRDGTIYVAAKTSTNAEAELYAGPVFAARARPPSWSESIVLTAATNPNDAAAFYALVDGDTLHRYEAGPDRWTRLDGIDCGFDMSGYVFTDLGPDDVLCNGPGGEIQRSDKGLKTIEVLPRSREHLTALSYFRELETTFAGSAEGSIFARNSEETWQTIYEPEALGAVEIRAFEVGRDDTLYIGGNLGTIGRYTADSGLCGVEDALVLGVNLVIRQLVALDGAMLFLIEDTSLSTWSVGAFR